MSFLSRDFLESYKQRPVRWGYPSGPNSLGEIVYRRTYSRDNEQWWQTVARVVQGTFSVLDDWCCVNCLPFSHKTARMEAEEMYSRIFDFKFTPPGRGLWMMGTEYPIERTGAALNNCGFVSTQNIGTELDKPFRFLMDMSMLGVGVGFDTLGAGKIAWNPSSAAEEYLIADSREGWVGALGALLRWGFGAGRKPQFDYSLIREKGLPIRGFGGISSGPEPLKKLLTDLQECIAFHWYLQALSSRHIVDIMNRIGACVVAGNVRRSAELALGSADDEEFLDLKDYSKNPERAAFGWASNNSVLARQGMDYDQIAERIKHNGEPGLVYMDMIRNFGRLVDGADGLDWRAMGVNPCGEQALESYELCCLVETYPTHHKSREDYLRTLKYAYLYAKAVTLVPSHWKETNAVMMRNRRIGTSPSGLAQFIRQHPVDTLIDWCENGYETIERYDRIYSEWLCIRESIRKTTVKPSGTVSLLAGVTPGVHWPIYRHYIRRVRFNTEHSDVLPLRDAGYKVEQLIVGYRDGEPIYDMNSVVVEFPVQGDPNLRTDREVSLGEKMHLAHLLQKYWADNQVSCTATFDPETEGPMIPDFLRAYEGKLKVISFLPIPNENAVYPQMPYERIEEWEYEIRTKDLKPIRWASEHGTHAEDDNFCDGRICEIQPSNPGEK